MNFGGSPLRAGNIIGWGRRFNVFWCICWLEMPGEKTGKWRKGKKRSKRTSGEREVEIRGEIEEREGTKIC